MKRYRRKASELREKMTIACTNQSGGRGVWWYIREAHRSGDTIFLKCSGMEEGSSITYNNPSTWPFSLHADVIVEVLDGEPWGM